MQFVAQPPVFAHLTFGQLRFGVLDGLGLGEDALPLVALPRPAPPHDDRRQPAQLRCSAGERRVAGGQELEVTQVDAVRAVWASVLHHENCTGTELASTLGTRPRLDRGEHY